MPEIHSQPHWNPKFYQSLCGKLMIKVGLRLERKRDDRKDRKICGCSLVKYVPSLYRETKGATGSEPTHYSFLEEIFADADLKSNDRFLDIGCGKGRVLAFLIRKGANWDLYGIELNPEIAAYAQNWTEQYVHAEIIQGDAFAIDYNAYTILSLGRPFETEAFIKFVQKAESELTHPITLYYWWDSQSGNYLDGRPGWTLHRRKWFFKHALLPVYPYPQRYSVWTFTPTCCRQSDAG